MSAKRNGAKQISSSIDGMCIEQVKIQKHSPVIYVINENLLISRKSERTEKLFQSDRHI